MQWIECIERRNGALGILVSENHREAPVWHPSAQLSKFMPAASGTCRRRLTLDFGDWSQSSAKKYLAILGYAHEPMAGHMVFSFHNDGTEYLVPAIVVIQALFRPLRYLSPYLFHPTSLEQVSTPTGNKSAFSAALCLDPIDKRYNEPIATQALFTWVWAYPSARRMWSSLYQHALRGTLGITLPFGTVCAVFHGVAQRNQIAVTEMRVMKITTTELSELEVPPETNTFILHNSAVNAPIPKCNAEQRLIKSMGGSPRPLTDDEWGHIQDVLNRRPRARLIKLDQRSLLNGIITKLVTGTPWRNMAYAAGDWRHASTNYRRWKIAGVWNEICSRLLDTCQLV